MEFNFDEFVAWVGEDTDTLMMLIWIIPVIIFVFYGQRIQLIISSNEIKKDIEKLEQYTTSTKKEFLKYVKNNLTTSSDPEKKLDSFFDYFTIMPVGQRIQLIISSNEIKKDIEKLEQYTTSTKKEFLKYVKNNLTTSSDPEKKLDSFFDYFTIMPVDLDPNGIISKINHLVRSREDFIRLQINNMFKDLSSVELSKLQNLLEIVTTLQLFHKHTRHLYLTAKKQKNFPLILPLQMMIPFLMEEAEALKDAMAAIKRNQPIGDSIGPMIIGELMLDTKKENVELGGEDF